jgi:hypothetical protein
MEKAVILGLVFENGGVGERERMKERKGAGCLWNGRFLHKGRLMV